jgi:hypothetical protein
MEIKEHLKDGEEMESIWPADSIVLGDDDLSVLVFD